MQQRLKCVLFVVALVVGLVLANEGDVVVLTDATFDTSTASGEWLLEFYAPWCGHCKKLAPIYEELATKVKGQFNVAKVDCTVEKGLATRFSVKGYPTIKFLKDGQIYDYAGQRDVNAFVEFMEKGYTSANKGLVPKPGGNPQAAEKSEKSEKSDVVVLTDSNFEELTSKGSWFLEFYAPWCGHCKNLAPTYEKVGTALKGVVNVGKVDCTVNRAVCAQYGVEGYPTIYYKRENEIYAYNGPRNVEEFKKFAETGWKQAPALPVPEPLSGVQALFQSFISKLENFSVDVWLVVVGMVVVGVVLAGCVCAMSPEPAAASKTIHYQASSPASSSSSNPGSSLPGEITEEVSKAD